MKKYLFRSLITIVIFAGFGLSGILYQKLNQERETVVELGAELTSINRSLTLAKQKILQETARFTVLTRAKLALDARIRDLQQQVNDISSERDSLIATKAFLEESWQKKTETMENQLAALVRDREKLEKARDELKEVNEQQAKDMSDLHEQASKLESKITETKATLRQETRLAERYRLHNVKLSEISVELIDKYRNKHLDDSLLENEPFTGIRRIEVENMLQNYLDRIDQQKIDKQG